MSEKELDNWIPLDDVIIDNTVNAIHCDTRDFHCLLKAEHNLEIHENDVSNSLIKQDEILPFLKDLESSSGGKVNWRFLSFEEGVWIKYIRFFRKDEDIFIIADRQCNPLNIFSLNKEKINKQDLNAY